MSDQYPTYPPPPNQMPAPTAPPAPPAPPSPQYPQQYPPQQPPAGGSSKRTLLIITGIIVAVLVICGCAVAAGVLVFRSVDDVGGSVSDTTGNPDDSDARLDEWLAWRPEITGETLIEAPPEKLGLISESLEIVAPDFEPDTIFMIDGYYSADEDWYYADYIILTARHPSSDALWAGIEFSIQSDLMVAEDISFDPEEGDVITTIADGSYELSYFPQWVDGVDDDLWEQIGSDWPDAVVMDIYASEATPGAVVAEITNWDAYAIESYSPRVEVTYQPSGGTWELIGWEYRYSADETDNDSTTGDPT